MIRERMVSSMKNSKTPLSNTKVHLIDGEIYRAIIPFDDGSFLTILFRINETEDIHPCTSADKFIYSSISTDIKQQIYNLYKNL